MIIVFIIDIIKIFIRTQKSHLGLQKRSAKITVHNFQYMIFFQNTIYSAFPSFYMRQVCLAFNYHFSSHSQLSVLCMVYRVF